MSSKAEFGHERREDVISGFPDEMLCHIMSFLPLREAVRVRTLSTRWRNLRAANLDIDDTFLSRIWSRRKKQEIGKNFSNYVKKMINNDNITGSFQRLRICCSIIPAKVVHSWVLAAAKHDVRHLDLLWHGDRLQLPEVLFTSTSLEVLKLEGNHLGISDTVWLPNLKTLVLDFKDFGNYLDLDVFLSNCPALEDLCIKRHVVEMKKLVFDISSRKLRRLQMEFVNGNLWDPYKLVIDAPNLKYLDLKDCQTKYFEVRNVGSLVEAHVDWKPKFHGSENYDDHCGQITDLVKGITMVKFLSLASHVIIFLYKAFDFEEPMFNNLKHLQLDVAGDLVCLFLARFLHCAPKLETLTLINKDDVDMTSYEEWSPPDRVPECMLSHLREIVVRGLSDEAEFEAVMYLLEHSQVLSKLTVECGYSATEDETVEFYEDLTRSPKASAACQITLVSTKEKNSMI